MPSNCLAFVRQSNSSVQTSFITDNEGFATSYQNCFVFQHFSNQPCKLLIMRRAMKQDNFEECEGA